MIYSIPDIARIVSAEKVILPEDRSVSRLLIDSRNMTHSDGVLFFAIRGERHDAHDFLPDLFSKGVRNFVVSRLPDDCENSYPDSSFILVKDTLAALQTLATHHRKRFTYPVISVTGSNGKTIVKEWLWQLLRDDFSIVRSPKSYNSQVGVPLSVWNMDESNTLGIFEAGISRSGEMEKLESILLPDIALLTNIGTAHDENFTGRSQKTEEKLILLRHAKQVVCCKDDTAVFAMIQQLSEGKQLFTWSRKTKSDLQVARITKEKNETRIQGIFKNRFSEIVIPFTDDASVENAIHCWSMLLLLGTDEETIAARMKQLMPVAMRLELKEGVNGCSVINDSYNSDLGSIAVALDFLNQQQQHARKTVILSDILQSGLDENALYTEVSSLVRSKGVSRFIGIGKAVSHQQEKFAGLDTAFYSNTQEFLANFHSGTFHNETILIKGARPFGFEAISKALQQKAHETVLEIDLNALVHNLNYFRSRLNPGTQLMAMVKAFSYGSGSFEIANVLQFHRVDYLAVAYADEGVELRKAGITIPVMVMNPEEQSFDTMIRHGLEPEIFSFRILQLFSEAAKRFRQRHPGQAPVPVHVKLDTGMRRLGFDENELNELIVRLKNSRDLTVRSVFSHLAASDENMHDDFTRKQVKAFITMSDELKKHFSYPILRHILNSAGITRFPDSQFEMVRLGIGLYGIGVNEAEQKNLLPVSTLRTTISQIKNISEGESIGYSRKWIAKSNMRIATVPIGYADGLSRRLSNGGGKMFVHGKACRVVGNVCMDMCMIDVTGISCSEGDEVTVFGKEHPITDIAKDMGTIPYEVLTNVSRRVKRVYYQE
ncbi:MAG TPA: bifunctional UDP-N-acetylmuramoyl-tripeptide:D-alanyl-D-alanine ligase/alanine racemase [Bacteroidia bacterium]|nr:bifunctional UDP-N-acetylmuramoyl-tripeptide:D-alanyl-D-alanine ligase/alanine racemase [Bacteroidia bacterium]